MLVRAPAPYLHELAAGVEPSTDGALRKMDVHPGRALAEGGDDLLSHARAAEPPGCQAPTVQAQNEAPGTHFLSALIARVLALLRLAMGFAPALSHRTGDASLYECRLSGCHAHFGHPQAFSVSTRLENSFRWVAFTAPDARRLRQVRELLAQATSTTFPAEARACRAKAAELMDRYGISERHLRLDGPTVGEYLANRRSAETMIDVDGMRVTVRVFCD